MKKTFFILFTLILLLKSSLSLSGELDNYYLEKFGELPASTSVTLFKASANAIADKCGMPLRKSLKKDWNQLEESTRKVLAKQLEKPILDYYHDSVHFRIHYTRTAPHAPPLTDNNGNTLPDWVETVAAIFEEVYDKEINTFGYTPPPTAPAARYDVYLQQRIVLDQYGRETGDFGYTESDTLTGQSATSFIVIDNDFADGIYSPYNGLTGLQITAAHEFHHAIQYGYNYWFDQWYAEATSTWIEDEVYDSVNQLYVYSVKYLQYPSLSLDTATSLSTGGGYGRWIFNRALTEKYSTTEIRLIWERLRNTPASGFVDIPMLPVLDSHFRNLGSSVGAEFIDFAKKLYTKEWSSHTSETNLIYSTPLSFKATFSSYPVNQATSNATSVTLPHYAMAYHRFTPSASVTDLTISINKSGGVQAAVLKKSGGIFSEIPVNINGASFTINGFSTLNPATDEIVLLLVNTSYSDNLQANISTDGSSPPVSVSSGGSSGGGCFIATAAYGSYLHPKVMVLRKIRDDYMLTNAPGRAFVYAYYRISPPVADFIRQNETLRIIVQLLLAPVIFAAEHLLTAVAACVLLFAGAFMAIRNKPIKQFNTETPRSQSKNF